MIIQPKSVLLNPAAWRTSLWRREIIVICLFAFLVDTMLGATRPILSLFAQSLGASLTLVGSLSLVVGLTQLIAGVPIGALSDRRGRKGVLIVGALLLSLTALSIAVARQLYWLLPTQVLLGLGFVSSLTVTMAYVADVATLQERSLAIGLVATMMGLGYAVGAWLGGTVADKWGYTTAYLTAAVIALTALMVAWLGLPDQPTSGGQAARKRPPLRQQMMAMAGNRMILAISLGALLIFLVFGGLVVAFFPLYAHSLGLSQAAIGSMLAGRTLASTLARLPGGALAVKIPGQWILLAAMLMALIFAFGLPQLHQPGWLTALLIGEGIAYGLYLTIGQTLITAYADEVTRGAALGMYSTVTGIGGSLIPFFLGVIADAFGLASVFYLTGSLLLLGIGFLVWVSLSAYKNW